MTDRRVGGVRPLLAAAALVAVAAVLAALLGAPPAGDDTGPRGMAALKRLLRARGIDVGAAEEPAGEMTFFLPVDARTPAQAGALLEWVEGGGRLVIADPSSPTLTAAGVAPHGSVGGIAPVRVLKTDCGVPAVVGVGAIAAASTESRLGPGPAEAIGCFLEEGGAFLVERRLGRGSVLALGGPTPLTNEFLRERDNVVLGWNLLGAPGNPVVLGTPRPAGASSGGLWSLLPPPARVIVGQMVLAAVLFALARGRRLGKPVEEVVPSPLPASSLIQATADLYRRGRASAHAVAVLQARFRAHVGRRLGLGPSPSPEAVVRAAAARGDVRAEDLEQVLAARSHADERQLVAVARRLDALQGRIEGEP